MKLLKHIIVKVIVPLVLGVLLIGATSIVVILTQTNSWIAPVRATLQNNSLSAFVVRSQTVASLVDTTISSYVSNTIIATTYIRDVLKLPGSGANAITTTKPYTSYFAAQLDNGNDPALPPSTQQFLFSAYFNNLISTTDQFNARNPDPTTTFDNVFRAITVGDQYVQAIQTGFEDNGWRIYPLVYNITRFDPRIQQTCLANNSGTPSELIGATGYIAKCRTWYIGARQAGVGAGSSVFSTGLGPVVLSTPYKSSSSTGAVLITGSQAFYNSSSLIGVLGLQIQMGTLTGQISNSSVLSNGYVFMIDAQGNIISYPKTKTSIDVFAQVTTIGTVEFNNDPNLLNAFNSALTNSLNTNQPQPFTKPDGSAWTLAGSSVPGTNYTIVVVAPNSDISQLSDNIAKSANMIAIIAIVVTVVAVLVTMLVSYRVTKSQADRVLKPIDDLGRWLDQIAAKNLSIEPSSSPAIAKELGVVNENFRNLLVAIRFGNQAYYANDLARALENYEAAEAMMIKFRNERGRGVCLNNKGNVYKQLNDRFNEAVDAYSRAIEIAETMLQAETDIIKKRQLTVVLANRISNLGVLYKDLDITEDFVPGGSVPAKREMSRNQARAFEHFNRALQLHRSVDNIEGIAQTSGNLGQLLLSLNDIDAAAELIRDSYDIVRRSVDTQTGKVLDPIAMQYACMNMGMLADRLGRPAEAVTWYTYVLQRFDVVVSFVQRTCVLELIRICEETDEKKGGVNRPELARIVKEVARPVFGDLVDARGGAQSGGFSYASHAKNVWFVLDISGSMAGGYIRACRSSIIEIIENHCSALDSISMTVFNSVVTRLFRMKSKQNSGDQALMENSVMNQTMPTGATAFYDATLQAVQDMQSVMSSNTNRDNWVIALTDGGDNMSQPSAVDRLKRTLQSNPGIGLIVITVGKLENEYVIKSILDCVPGGKNKGMLIRSETNSNAIKDAFGQAVRVMAGGNLNVERL